MTKIHSKPMENTILLRNQNFDAGKFWEKYQKFWYRPIPPPSWWKAALLSTQVLLLDVFWNQTSKWTHLSTFKIFVSNMFVSFTFDSSLLLPPHSSIYFTQILDSPLLFGTKVICILRCSQRFVKMKWSATFRVLQEATSIW